MEQTLLKSESGGVSGVPSSFLDEKNSSYLNARGTGGSRRSSVSQSSMVTTSESAPHESQGSRSIFDEVGKVAYKDLAARSYIFREKLIEEFRLMESSYEFGSNAPHYSTQDLVTAASVQETFKAVLRETPMQLIKFKMFKRSHDHEKRKRNTDKRMVRIKNINSLPIGVWAKWAVENTVSINIINALIMISALVMGLQAELDEDDQYESRRILKLFDNFILAMFLLEILLKWIDSFYAYWKDPWNVFDFTITVFSLVPELLELASPGSKSAGLRIAKKLRLFRVFRSLKMVSRFRNLRVIVRTILEAFESFGYIMLLLMMLFYIYGVLSISLFESYTLSTSPGLKYRHKFSNLLNAFLSLFQLLTLDQWYNIANEISSHTAIPIISLAFFVTWVWIGAFIFRNIFIGVMVKNFRSISADLLRQERAAARSRKMDRLWKKLNRELATRDMRNTKSSANLKSLKDTNNSFQGSDAQNRSTHSIPHSNVSASDDPHNKDNASTHDDPLEAANAELKKHRSSKHAASRSSNENSSGTVDANMDISSPSPKQRAMNDQQRLLKLLKKAPSAASMGSDFSLGQPVEESLYLGADAEEAMNWQEIISKTLPALASRNKETNWPRDTLFTYLQTMENLQENMKEYEELQQLAAWALYEIHDT